MDDTMNPDTEVEREFAPAIGIDLGTSKCCVGVVRKGKVIIIENERGNKITPSYVAFTKTMRIIGEDAKNQAAQNPTNTVFGVKRIVGRSFDDPSLEVIKHNFPFTVKQEAGKPLIEVQYKDEKIDLSPEQVSAMLLTKMKLIAESHLKCKVTDAVISVPAYFNNAQRQATKDAAAIAGLKVLGLINEPTAAALAYRDNMGPTNETICVVDLGGGKLDVSIITLNADGEIKVEQTMGDTALGGMDFDQRLVDHFAGEFWETKNQTISKNGLERVRLACEKLKHKLSLLPTEKIQLDCLAMEMDFESSIDRKSFEDLCLKDLISVLSKALQYKKLGSREECVEKITKVVVIGGSTRIPLVQEILKNVTGKGLDKSVNQDEAVAHGAAIKAALLAGDYFLKEVKFQDVTAHGIVVENEQFLDYVIRRNSHKAPKKFTPPPDHAINAPFTLYEYIYNGKNDNKVGHSLGSVKLSDLAKPSFSEMGFRVDDSGIFCWDVFVDGKQCSIPFYADCLNAAQLAQLRSQELKFQADEEAEKERLRLLSKLGDDCYRYINIIEGLGDDGNSERNESRKKFIDLCVETIDLLDSNPEAIKDLCESKAGELQDRFGVLVQSSSNANTIEPNEQVHCGDNPKATREVRQLARRTSTENNVQSKGGLGEEEIVQDNRPINQEDVDARDQPTLQRDEDSVDGQLMENYENQCMDTSV